MVFWWILVVTEQWGSFFPLLNLDFGWLVVGCAFPWWWQWLDQVVGKLGFPFSENRFFTCKNKHKK